MHEEFGIERLFLVSRGKKLAVASFLGPDEKASFAKALGEALGEAKRGPTRDPLALRRARNRVVCAHRASRLDSGHEHDR